MQSLSEEMKRKRKEILEGRKELESEQGRQSNANTNRRNDDLFNSTPDDYEYLDEEEEEDIDEIDEDEILEEFPWIESRDSGSDSDAYEDWAGSGGGRPIVEGRAGAPYGGYGHCFRCGARGHWAPGCPL